MALAFFVLTAVSPSGLAQTPRYGLQPGQHTVYRRVVRSSGAGAPQQTRVQQLQYWTLDSKRMLGELTEVVGGKGQCRGGMVLQLDDRMVLPLDPVFLPQINELAPLLEAWPELPRALRATRDWKSTDAFGRIFRYAQLPRDPDAPGTTVWQVELLQDEGSGGLFGQTYDGMLWFDTRKRVVQKLDGTWRDAGSGRNTNVTLELYQQQKTPNDWLSRRKDELRRYRTTLGLQVRYLDRLTRDPAQGDRILASIGRFWSEQALQLTRAKGPLRRLVNERRVAWEAGLVGWQERVRQIEAWRDIQTPRWLLQTASGKAVRSDELGVPVLELLWSPLVLGSGSALQDLKELRSEIPLNDLAIICIHLHGDAEALARAEDMTGPDVLHLRPDKPSYEEGLRLPIARLRDAEGQVQEISYGARPIWREWLDKKLRIEGE